MEKFSFRVADFDAPLDLILHLISKHKLNIVDIDITSLLDQYMDIIQSWQSSDLDLASEFLEMASRLVHMKTVSLLPRHEEESERLRRELTGQLIEYQICKEIAESLGELLSMDSFVRTPMEFDIDPTYNGQHSPYLLFEALGDALGRGTRRLPPPSEAFEPLFSARVVSVGTKIFSVLRLLRRKRQAKLSSVLNPEMGRSGMVATFLAVLELMRSGKVMLEGEILSIPKKS